MTTIEEKQKKALDELKILRDRDPYHLTRVKEELGFNKNVVVSWIRSGSVPKTYVDAVLEVTRKLMELPLDEPSPETRNSKGRYACIYKNYVLCSDHTKCDKCGWAPEVERRRIAESREALK